MFTKKINSRKISSKCHNNKVKHFNYYTQCSNIYKYSGISRKKSEILASHMSILACIKLSSKHNTDIAIAIVSHIRAIARPLRIVMCALKLRGVCYCCAAGELSTRFTFPSAPGREPAACTAASPGSYLTGCSYDISTGH